MGILNYLKKIIFEDEKKESQTENMSEKNSTELTLPDIQSKTAALEKELLEKKDKLEKNSKALIQENISSLKDCLELLKGVNLDKRKEPDKLKELVLENVHIYETYLQKFIRELEEYPSIDDILKLFELFSKNSLKSYQKATTLVGEEFEKTESILKEFALNFNRLIKENQENNFKMSKFKEIDKNFEEIAGIASVENEIKQNLAKLKQDKDENEKTLIEDKNKIELIVKSTEYKEDSNKKEELRLQIKKLEQEMASTLEKINLKELAKICHENEKKHKIVQAYIANSKKAIEEDLERNFDKIVKETRGMEINLSEINNKIKELNGVRLPSEVELSQIDSEMSSYKKQITQLDKMIAEEESKLARFENKKQVIENKVKLEAKNIIKN